MKRRTASCSFCRKSYTEVGPLVEGSGGVHICGGCIELCQTNIEQERRRRNLSPPPGEPGLLRARLDHFVSGQEEAKQALALAVQSRNQGGGRALLIGPSHGVKLLLARALAHVLEAPFAAGEVTDLLESQIGSADGSPLLLRLLRASDFDSEAAQRGVVFVDGTEQPEVQDALLRLWQYKASESVAGLPLAFDRLLFVCGGCFAGLDERLASSGHHAERCVRVEDLEAVGVRPDWAAYLAGIARVKPLDEENLARIVQWVDFHGFNGAQGKPDTAAHLPPD